MIGRLLELFEGPEAPGAWTPPAVPAALHALLPWRAFDESSEIYVNAASAGFVLELPPFAGIDAETLGALAGTLADAAPERCTVQVIHWASPRFGGGRARLGRTEVRGRGRARSDGRGAPRPARPRRLAAAACGRAALHLVGLPGVRHRLPRGRSRSGRRDRARRVPPRARRHAGLGGRGNAAAGARRASVARGRVGRPRHGRVPRRRHGTPAAPLGAARPPARAVHRRRAARSRFIPRASRSITPTETTSPSGCSRRSPFPRSGRAGAATR